MEMLNKLVFQCITELKSKERKSPDVRNEEQLEEKGVGAEAKHDKGIVN